MANAQTTIVLMTGTPHRHSPARVSFAYLYVHAIAYQQSYIPPHSGRSSSGYSPNHSAHGPHQHSEFYGTSVCNLYVPNAVPGRLKNQIQTSFFRLHPHHFATFAENAFPFLK